MLLANISSFSSDFGSRPFHNRNSGLLGNGALMVPLPAFLPSLINHVFRKRALLRFSDFCSIDYLFDTFFDYLDGCSEIDYLDFIRIDLVDLS